MSRALAIACALAVAGCGATVAASSGNALVAPGTASGMSTSVRLYDRGGPVSKLVLQALAAVGTAGAVAGDSRTTTSSSSRDECYGTSCQRVTTTYVTSTYTGTPEQLAELARNHQRLSEAISNTPYRGFPFETVLEIASESLGGDTSGWMFWYWWHSQPRRVGTMAVSLSVGFSTGSLEFHDRSRTIAAGTSSGVITSTAVVPTSEHFNLGTPVRLSLFPRRDVWFYLQPDFNWAAVYEDWFADLDGSSDIEANPWRLGARARWRGFEAGVELVTDGMSTGARSLGGEVGYVF